MTNFLQVLEIAISAASLYLLYEISKTASSVLGTYLPKYRAIRTVSNTDYWHCLPPDCGETVWIYRKPQEEWVRSDESTPCMEGYEPAPKPAHKGEFDGHTVRRRCRRIPKPKTPKA